MNDIPRHRSDQRDRELEDRIRDALKSTGRGRLRHLRIDVTNGIATVQGVLPSYYERQLCIRSCHDIPGLRELVDEIEVETQR